MRDIYNSRNLNDAKCDNMIGWPDFVELLGNSIIWKIQNSQIAQLLHSTLPMEKRRSILCSKSFKDQEKNSKILKFL